MSVNSDSVLDLLGKLCDLHLGQTKRSHLVQPKTERNVHFHRLRRKAFDTLFTYLKSPESKQSCVGEGGGVRVEVDRVLLSIYQRRTDRRFHDADRMELLLQQLLEDWTEDKGRVLQLLTALTDTGQPPTPPPLGHSTYHTPIITQHKGEVVTLPGGPLNYGDSKSVVGAAAATAQRPYTLYPPQLFSATATTTIPTTPSSLLDHRGPLPASVFTMLPGTGMEVSHLFSTEKDWLDSHGQRSRMSLFGGLLHPRDTPISVTLQLPDLADDPSSCPPEINIPKALSMSELSEDEGFITTEGSSAATTPWDSGVEEDIWDLALSSSPCRNYVWERIGCEPEVTEKPYLTEAGPQVVDELCYLRRQHEHLLQPSPFTASTTTTATSSAARQLSPAQLCKDVICLLIGIPSRTFVYLREEGEFMLAHGVSTRGLSPEALRSLLGDLITCGTHYQRLAAFSSPQQAHAQEELPSAYSQGLVLQAFKAGIRATLQHYRAAVLSLPRTMSLLALHVHCGKAVRQIQFLAELCHCSTSPDHNPDAFPVGVALISYLYQETLNAVNTDNYLLMLSLLQHSCQPFVMFVQEWVFHGTFRDVYGEFMIQMNHKFLEARDETYWEHGFTMNQEDGASSVPSFLTSLASDIFRCGKALNLLRMCCPSHFVCGVNDSDIPQLSIVYTAGSLRHLGRQCDMYISRLQQMARQLSTSRAQQKQRAEEAQRELLETARRMAAQEIARLQGILDARRQRADVKKRKEFQRLKEQMTADLQRRTGEVAEARREDAEYMARLTHTEEALTEREIQLEAQARDELIAYYTELGEEAALRERRALWRIRRAQLETRRHSLLTADTQRWKAEMEEHSHAQSLLERGSDAENPLPEWAQQGEEGGTTHTLQVGGVALWDTADPTTTTTTASSSKDDRDWSLPKWAERSEGPGTDQQDFVKQPADGRIEEEIQDVVSQHSEERGITQVQDGVSQHSEERGITQVQDGVSQHPAERGVRQEESQSTSFIQTSLSEASTAIRTDSFVTAKSQMSAAMNTDSFTTVLSDTSSTGVCDTDRPLAVVAVKSEGFDLGLGLENIEIEVKTDRETDGGETERSSGSDREKDRNEVTDGEAERGAATEGETERGAPTEGETDRDARTEGETKRSTEDRETGPSSESGSLSHRGEDRMPAWARRFLHHGTDSSIDTLVIADNDNKDDEPANSSAVVIATTTNSDETASNPATSRSAASDIEEKNSVESGVGGVDGGVGSGGVDVGGGVGSAGGVDGGGDLASGPGGRKGIRMVAGRTSLQETEEEKAKTHIQISSSMGASMESSAPEDSPLHIRLVAGKSATTETTESWDDHTKTNITLSKTMHATKQSQETEQRPHLRMIADRNANVESSQELQSIPRLRGSGKFNASTETTEEEWRVKKASLFGHVSQLSKEDYSFQAPRLKRQRHLHPSVESEMREFAVRPHVRANKLRTVNEETEEKEARPGIRVSKARHVSLESEHVDVERLRRERFLKHNVFGHSSDSTVQGLLYGAGFGSTLRLDEIEEEGEVKELVPLFDISALDLVPDLMEPLPDHFNHLTDRAAVDLLASLPGVVHGGVGTAPWQGELTQEEADLITLTPLPILMQQALTAPLSAQVRLVDQTVMNYFLVEQSLDTHLRALHRYLFMADGDFAQNITDILLEKMSTCRLPQEMLTPVFLNGALNRALQLSSSTTQHHADRLSFSLRYTPRYFKHTSHDALDCLELRYKVDWPLNVVLTESCQKSYGLVFSFMLKLKRVAWSLNQCWHRLKRDAIVKKAKDSQQFRRLQLHRQEQQHFVRVMEGYMCSQIIELTWSELQQALDTEVRSLDDLRTVHCNYLHRALFRCLLNKKAAPIMKIILDIFSLILKFCALLNSATWEQNPATGEVTHPNFGAMVTAYQGFKKYFVFLFEVVTKLAVRGYQPHLHELLLRLNFNDFYTSQ